LNASKGFAWLSFLPYIIGAVAVAGTVYAGYRWYHGLCNDRCRIAEERATLAEEAIQVAQARATHLALLWANAINHVEVRYVEVVKERIVRVEAIRESAGKIKPATDAVVVPVPADASRVLSDSAHLANGTAPASGDSSPAQAVPETTDSTLTEWITFSVEAAAAYADAREKHQACVAFVGQITEAQQ
jgi:hypothetical protein